MLYTPPDLDGSPRSPETGSHDDADAQFAFDPLVGGCYGSQTKDASLERSLGSLQVRDRETSHSQLAVVEVAKQVVEMKRLEASTAVELERLKQSGATERTRLLEEGRTQRSACVAAVMKRVMEEHHQTERQKIESTAQVQQATIAARVSEAEAQANTPAHPMSHWLLLWLCLGQSRRVRKVGFPVLRVAGFLLVLRGIWSSGFKSTPVTLLQRAWRAVSTSLQQQLRDQLQPLQLSGRDRLPELPELPSLASASRASSTTSGHNLNTFHKELEDLGLAGYLEDLLNLGYDGETLRDLKNDAEVQEMLSAINCRPEHRVVFLKALQRWQ